MDTDEIRIDAQELNDVLTNSQIRDALIAIIKTVIRELEERGVIAPTKDEVVVPVDDIATILDGLIEKNDPQIILAAIKIVQAIQRLHMELRLS